MSRVKTALLLAFLLVIALAGVVLAYSTRIVGNYEYTLLGAVYDTNTDQTTWQYAVSGPTSSAPASVKGLSHWTLPLDIQECGGSVVTPTTGPYTTLATDDYGFCDAVALTTLACQVATYPAVIIGADGDPQNPPDTVSFGIKFADASDNFQELDKDNPGTHIFEFVTSGGAADTTAPNTGISKEGNQWLTGDMDSPSCTASPAAISLSSVNIGGGDSGGLFVVSLALLGIMLVATAAVWRRQTV